MPERKYNCCDERDNRIVPAEREAISATAERLLVTLKGIEGRLDVIDRVLFGTEPKEDRGVCPDCLNDHIGFATESAMSITCKLDRIIERL